MAGEEGSGLLDLGDVAVALQALDAEDAGEGTIDVDDHFMHSDLQ